MAHNGAQATLLDDTSPKARAYYLSRLRAASAEDRLDRALRLSEQVRAATMAEIEERFRGASRDEVEMAFLRRVYGDEIAAKVAHWRLTR
jgi:hypothetical protein